MAQTVLFESALRTMGVLFPTYPSALGNAKIVSETNPEFAGAVKLRSTSAVECAGIETVGLESEELHPEISMPAGDDAVRATVAVAAELFVIASVYFEVPFAGIVTYDPFGNDILSGKVGS